MKLVNLKLRKIELMIEPLTNQTLETQILQPEKEKSSMIQSAYESLEALMEELEKSLNNFDEASETFKSIYQLKKNIGVLRKESPVDAHSIENYHSRVEKTCLACQEQFKKIIESERDRVLEAQRQKSPHFLNKITPRNAEFKTLLSDAPGPDIAPPEPANLSQQKIDRPAEESLDAAASSTAP